MKLSKIENKKLKLYNVLIDTNVPHAVVSLDLQKQKKNSQFDGSFTKVQILSMSSLNFILKKKKRKSIHE